MHFMQIDGIVTKHVPDVVLGLDWLRKHKAQWDFASDSISIEGRAYRLQSRPANNWCRRIIVQDSIIVPAMTEMVISTLVQYSTLNDDEADDCDAWSTEATEPVVGLRVSRALVPGRSTDVPVRVMNVTTEPLELKTGRVMSILQPVTTVGTCNLPAPNKSDANLQVLRKLVDDVDGDVPMEARDRLTKLLIDYSGYFPLTKRTWVVRMS